MKLLLSKKSLLIGISTAGFLIFLGYALPAFAVPPASPYMPGETLDPGCAPGATNCTVTPPLSATTTLTTGSIPFIGNASGTVFENNANFFWDNTNNRLGIGTSTPSATLTVSGGAVITGRATTTALTISGITGSVQCLQVDANGVVSGAGGACGTASLGGAGRTNQITFWNSTTTVTSTASIVWSEPSTLLQIFGTVSTTQLIAGSSTFGSVTFSNATNTLLFANSAGAVGTTSIGTGLNLAGNVLSNTGVTSFNGATGSVTGVGALASGTNISVSGATGTVTVNFTPGFLTAASSVTWTAIQTFIGGAAFNSTATFNSSTVVSNTTNTVLSADATGKLQTTTLSGGLSFNGSTLAWANGAGFVTAASSVTWSAAQTFNNSATFNGGQTFNTTSTFAANVTLASTTCGAGQVLSTNGSGVVQCVTDQTGAGTTTINGITSSTFNFLAAGTGLTVASSANPNNITYTWTNPGFITSASSVTWTTLQAFTGGLAVNSTATFNSSTIFSVATNTLLSADVNGKVQTTTFGGIGLSFANNTLSWTNSAGYITTSTGLTVANFATTSISQWNNDAGYITSTAATGVTSFNGATGTVVGVSAIASGTNISASNSTGTVTINFVNPGFVTAASSVTWSAAQTFSNTATFNGSQAFNATATFNSSTVLSFISGTQCLHTVNGVISGTGSDCGAGGGGASTTIINGVSSTQFTFAAGANLSVATSAGPTITYAFVNPGFVTAASSVTWSAAQTFNATTLFSATATFASSVVISSNNLFDASGNKYSTSTTSSAAGSNTQIQFNNGGAFGANSFFTFSSSTDLLAISSSTGGIVIGTSTKTANALLTIATSSNILSFLSNGNIIGNLTNIVATGTPIQQAATTTLESGPYAIYVSGRYAYVTNVVSNTLSVVDISNPKAPLQIATTSVGTGPRGLFVSGRYAYVANSSVNSLSVVDISNPKAPLQIATTSVGSNPRSVYVSGRYAYVANRVSATISVVDISNPAAPIQVATTSVGSVPQSIFVSGRYAYVANNGSASLSVVDISNPLAPVRVSTTTTAQGPNSVYVSGRYAYLANNIDQTLSIIDVSNPNAPSQIANLTFIGAEGVFVSGRYAYVTDNANTLSVVDVSTPSAPMLVAAIPVNASPEQVFVSGRYAYITNGTAATDMSVVDISGAETNGLVAGAADLGNLQVQNDAIINGQLQVTGGGTFGNGGIYSAGALTVSATTTPSTFLGGLLIGTTTNPSNSLLTIGTSTNILSTLKNGNVGIGTSAPLANLNINNNQSNGDTIRPFYISGTGYTMSNGTQDPNGGSHGLLTIGTPYQLVYGGTQIIGNSNDGAGGTYPLALIGAHNVSSPSNGFPAVYIGGQKWSGSGSSYSNLSGNNIILGIGASSNGGGVDATQLFSFLANGNFGIGTTTPASLLTVGANGGFQVNNTGNVTTTNITVSGVTSTLAFLSSTGVVGTTSVSTGLNLTGNVLTNTGVTSFNGATGTVTGVSSIASGTNISASAATGTVTINFVNPGFVTAASSVTWTAAQTFNATTLFSATATFASSVVISSNNLIDAGGNKYVTSSVASVAGSNTQVQFNNGGSFGANSFFTFTSSTDLLAISSSSGGIIIGTSTNPSNSLFTIATSSNILSVLKGGNVGIGTAAPNARLEVDGNSNAVSDPAIARIFSSGGQAALDFYANATSVARVRADSSNDLAFVSGIGLGSGNFDFFTGGDFGTGTEQMRLWYSGGLSLGSSYIATDPGAGNQIISGKLGIGTTTPASLLTVGANGGFQVNNTGNVTTTNITVSGVTSTLAFLSSNGVLGTTSISTGLSLAGNVLTNVGVTSFNGATGTVVGVSSIASGTNISASAATGTVTINFVNPGFVTAASSVTWTAAQTFNAGLTANSTATFNSSTIFSVATNTLLSADANGKLQTTTFGGIGLSFAGNTLSWNNTAGFLTNASITANAPITWSAGNVIGFNTSTALTLSGLYTFNGGVTANSTATFNSSTIFSTATSTLAFLDSSGRLGTTSISTGLSLVGNVLTNTGVTSFNGATGTISGVNSLTGSGCVTNGGNATGSITLTVTCGPGTVTTSSAGVANTIPMWTSGSALGNSILTQNTSGTAVLISALPAASSSFSLFNLGNGLVANGSASGTLLGANTASAYNGYFLEFENNGVTGFRVASSGATTIGTSTNVAGALLSIATSSNILTVLSSGNVGIGTTNATRNLDVRGTAQIVGTNTAANTFGVTNTATNQATDTVAFNDNPNITTTGSANSMSLQRNATFIASSTLTGSVLNAADSLNILTGIVNATSTATSFNFARTSSVDAGTLTVTGPLAAFSANDCSNTFAGGTCASSADVVQINQQFTDNTGAALNITTAATGPGAFALRVNHDGTFTDTHAFVVNYLGNVGVGTTTPTSPLTVSGGGFFTGNVTTTNLTVSGVTSTLAFLSSNGVVGTTSIGSNLNLTGNVLSFVNPGFVTAASSVTWTAAQTFNATTLFSATATFASSVVISSNNLIDAGGNKYVTSTVASAAGSSNQVQFNNGGSLGANSFFTFSSSTDLLAISSSSGGIIVGTSTNPSNSLFTIATSSNIMTVLKNGNIGIGTSVPLANLNINNNQSNGDTIRPFYISGTGYTMSNGTQDPNGGSHGLLSIGTPYQLAYGGNQIVGNSNDGAGGTYPLALIGAHNISSPSNGFPAVYIGGQKWSGSGSSYSNLSGNNIILGIGASSNGGGVDATQLFSFLANGNFGIGTTTPASLLTIGAAGGFQVNNTGNVTTTNITVSGVTSTLAFLSSSGVLGTTSISTGLSLTGNVLANTGVTSFNGATGTITGVSAIASGTNISATAATGTVTINFVNPGFVTAASSVTWTALQTFNTTTTIAANLVLASSTGCNASNQALQTNGSGTVACATLSVGGSAGGSSDQVQFNNANALAGNSFFTFSSSTDVLAISSSSGAIIIGTSTNVTNSLFTIATSSNILTVLKNGNVGIGTTTPASALSVQGSATISGSLTLRTMYAGVATSSDLIIWPSQSGGGFAQLKLGTNLPQGSESHQTVLTLAGRSDSVTNYFNPELTFDAYNPNASTTVAPAYGIGSEGNYTNSSTFSLYRFYLYDYNNNATVFYIDKNNPTVFNFETDVLGYTASGSRTMSVQASSTRLDLNANSAFGGFATFGTASNNPLLIETNANERARFDASGNFMIGTSTSRGLLTVDGSSTFLGAFAVQSNVTSTTAIIFGSASTSQILTVDTLNNRTQIGNGAGSASPALLVLDTKNTSGDPTGVNGAMYYNSNSNLFRCYINGAWGNCDNATSTRSMDIANYMPDNSGEVFQEPFATSSIGGPTNGTWTYLITAFGSSTSTAATSAEAVFGNFNVPMDFSANPKIVVPWTSATSSGVAQWLFQYRNVCSAQDLDSTTSTESISATSSAPATKNFLVLTTLALTANNLTPGCTIQFKLSLNGASSTNTISSTVLMHIPKFQYTIY